MFESLAHHRHLYCIQYQSLGEDVDIFLCQLIKNYHYAIDVLYVRCDLTQSIR